MSARVPWVRGTGVGLRTSLAFVCLVGAGLSSLDAQEFRGQLRSRVHFAELRPMRLDSIDAAAVTEVAPRAFEYEGLPVYCVTRKYCTRYLAGEVEETASATQDLTLTGWGFGVQGLSTVLTARNRQRFAGDLLWPRSDDAFDLLVGYAQLDRGRTRFRAGRLRSLTGLGRASYDGGSVRVRAIDGWSVEAFGGRSHALGYSEPRHEALQSLDDFVPDRNAAILGASVFGSPMAGASVTARYQREILSDRSGLLSERAAFDGRALLGEALRLSVGADYDFAFGRVGKAHVSLLAPFSDDRLLVEIEARRYVPYFELWTIWGFFDPVGYREGSARVTWSASRDRSLWLRGGWRWYEDTETIVVLSPLEDQSRSLEMGGHLARGDLTLMGSYRMEWGAGAYLGASQLVGRWALTPDAHVSVHADAFQQIEEFRLGDGVTWGGGIDADVLVTSRIRLDGGVTVFRNTFDGRPGSPDWNQVRAWTAVTLELGRDPGTRTLRGFR